MNNNSSNGEAPRHRLNDPPLFDERRAVVHAHKNNNSSRGWILYASRAERTGRDRHYCKLLVSSDDTQSRIQFADDL